MKTVTLLVTILTSTIAFNTQADSIQFDTSNADRNTHTCIAAATNDLDKLKSLMGLEQYGEKNVVENLHCNELTITEFATKYHAYDSIAYLNKFLHKNRKVDVVALANSQQNSITETAE
ncbi:DUF3718 domain-containing protein [Thalassotalea psychrophila]|uniref:DUF3718 domain-containing protein n=1 Tax=Thalassotalea psychrophila TaxID=3065647 RepID=A0ABY9TTJ5_9GAMM|nr:DUF3718 domain-containing protein [Colwelliaceae bacterium SQ149]